MFLTHISVKNPVFAAMLMTALLVLGLFSWQRLPIEQFPDIKFPFAIVTTQYPGASPEVVESEISKKLEEQLNTISGVKTIRSISSEGQSLLIVEFSLSTNILDVMPDVREKVSQVKSGFKDEVKEPVISRWNPDDLPITAIGVTSKSHSLKELTEIADRTISKRLQALGGLGSTRIIGGERREIQIQLDPQRLRAFNVGADTVLNVLRQENQDLPAGTVSAGNRDNLVEIKGRIKQIDEFKRLIIANRNGNPIYLEQVASIVDTQAEPESRALINGQPALSIELLKVQGANTIRIVDDVNALLPELKKDLPPGVELQLVGDTSRGIRNSVNDVKSTLIEGAFLTIFIVFVFLGSWRSTVITGLALPIALVGTLWTLSLFGFTINTMTLMALSLCVGLLIDDAIVVRENIVRHLAMGKTPYRAAIDGTNEIGLAVTATTLSIVAVFLPVGFMGGIIGRFFYQFGITVVSAVVISLLVAFILDPMLSSIWPDPHENRGASRFGRIYLKFEALLNRLNQIYARLIAWSLDHRKSVLAIAFGSLIGAFVLARFIGTEFVPQPDLSEVNVRAETPQGASLEYTTTKANQVSAIIQSLPEVTSVYTSLNKTQMQMKVLLKPRNQRSLTQAQVISQLRDKLAPIAGLKVVTLQAAGAAGGDEKLVQISIQGPDLRQLALISADLTDKLSKVKGLVDIETSLKAGKPSLAIEIDPEKANRLGINRSSISASLQPLISGSEIGVWQDRDGETYPVLVRLPKAERESADSLLNLPLSSQQLDNNSNSPRLVTLSQVATVKDDSGASKINRKSLFREVLITANVAGRPAGDAGVDIKAIQDAYKLPPGYRFENAGSNKDMEESMGFAVSALAMAVIFIYLILASQFNSLLHPLAIMTSLPLSLIGVLLALLMWNSTLNIFSIIGVIMLMGLVTKNAILLVDFIEQSVKEGMEQRAAIIESGRVRLRPILMTTFAMIFGMLPLALGLGEGAEQRAPMAHALIGGVVTSTLLTLIVVPVVYTYLDQFQVWFLGKIGVKAGAAD